MWLLSHISSIVHSGAFFLFVRTLGSLLVSRHPFSERLEIIVVALSELDYSGAKTTLDFGNRGFENIGSNRENS